MPETRRNQTFNWLQAVLIIMVIDDHVSTRIGFLSSLFPYNSFYMPLFVAISGYFFKRRSMMESIRHKIRRLLLPYLCWNVIGNGLAYCLQKAQIVYWYKPWDWKGILKMLVWDPISSIIGAGWFAAMLFTVSVTYILLDYWMARFRSKLSDYVLMGILCAAGSAAVWFCIYRYEDYIAFIARTLFYLQFYHMGYMFSVYWEKKVEAWRREVVCGFCIAANVILICLFNDKVNYYSTSGMKHFHYCILPLITSMTGGLFWYEVCGALAAYFPENRVVNLLAENTFTIMMSHLMLLNIPNVYGYFQAIRGNTQFGDFDIAAFQLNAWYRYRPNFRLVGFFCGLIGSMLIILGLKKIRTTIKNEFALRAVNR